MNANNIVQLTGNASTAPKDFSKGDISVAKLLLITDDGYFGDDDVWVEDNDANYVTFFGSAAKKVIKHVSKGQEISIVGRLRSDSYENENRETVYTNEVQVTSASMVQLRGAKISKSEANKKAA